VPAIIAKLLPFYHGKTIIHLRVSWDVTFSPNHWCNEVTMRQCVRNIIVPYVQDTRKSLYLNNRALWIFDNFKAQHTDGISQLLEDKIAIMLSYNSSSCCYGNGRINNSSGITKVGQVDTYLTIQLLPWATEYQFSRNI